MDAAYTRTFTVLKTRSNQRLGSVLGICVRSEIKLLVEFYKFLGNKTLDSYSGYLHHINFSGIV